MEKSTVYNLDEELLEENQNSRKNLFLLPIQWQKPSFWIIILLVIITSISWLIDNQFTPISDYLLFSPSLKNEIWRWITYILVHSDGLQQIGIAVFLLFIFGITLGQFYNWWALILIYIGGALTGSITSSLTSPLAPLTGSSAAISASIGAHISGFIADWHDLSKYQRVVRLIWISAIILCDFLMWCFNGDNRITHASHLTGLIFGILMGLSVHPYFENVNRIQIVSIGILCVSIFSGLLISFNLKLVNYNLIN